MHKLYIKQKAFKIIDHYDVLDEAAYPVYEVDKYFNLFAYSVRAKRHDGTSSFEIIRSSMTWFPHYDVKFSDGKKMQIRANFSWTSRDLDLISDDYRLKVIGSYSKSEYQILNGDKLLGRVYKEKISKEEVFTIEVIDSYFEDYLLAIVIVIDSLKSD